MSVLPLFGPVLSVSFYLRCCVYACRVMCRHVLSHLRCVCGAFGVMYVVLRVHVDLRRPAACKCSSLFLSCLVCVFVLVELCV